MSRVAVSLASSRMSIVPKTEEPEIPLRLFWALVPSFVAQGVLLLCRLRRLQHDVIRPALGRMHLKQSALGERPFQGLAGGLGIFHLLVIDLRDHRARSQTD